MPISLIYFMWYPGQVSTQSEKLNFLNSYFFHVTWLHFYPIIWWSQFWFSVTPYIHVLQKPEYFREIFCNTWAWSLLWTLETQLEFASLWVNMSEGKISCFYHLFYLNNDAKDIYFYN